MKPFRWNHGKNGELKAERGISFEEIVLAIEADGLCDVVRHPNNGKYPNQHVFIVALDGYVYMVPFVEEGLPYQTFIASVLHKYVAGRLIEKPSRLTSRSSGRATKHRAA